MRFTLRKEYFGGLVHDAKAMTCHVLSPSEYSLLRTIVGMMTVEGVPTFSLSGNSTALERFKKIGLLEEVPNRPDNVRVVGIRLIAPPENIPDHCLTAPIRIYHTYSRACNLNCSQCCSRSSLFDPKLEQRMSVNEIDLVMKKFHDAGTMEWRFTGGEPTYSPDFPISLATAKSLGMAVMLNTNGCWSEKHLDELPGAGLQEVIVSLEGTEATNDSRRGPGVFRNIFKLFNRLQAHNRSHPEQKVQVTVNMTVAKDNVGDVEFVVRTGAEFGWNVNFVPLRPYGRALDGLSKNTMTTRQFMSFSENVQRLRDLPEIKASGIKIIHRNMDLFCQDYPNRDGLPVPFDYSDCGALTTGFGLSPDGHVNACSFLMTDPDFIGPSMVTASVTEAWLHPNMERSRKAQKIGCTGCRFYRKQCEGKCRAMVLANGGRIENGKLLGLDPYCYRAYMPRA